MRIDVITIFPEYLEPLRAALLGKAIDNGLVEVGVHNLRDWTHDVHHKVDDTPFGGGPGMVMLPNVWADAITSTATSPKAKIIVPTPAGRPFTQELAKEFSKAEQLIFACGRYEGIDQRVIDWAGDNYEVEEVSIGDYVLIGGEVATMVMVEALARFIPGVLGNAESYEDDSFSDGLLEAPCYTRPRVWNGYSVPDVLTTGNHEKIAAWRREQSLIRTARVRPDLIQNAGPYSPKDEIAIHGRRLTHRYPIPAKHQDKDAETLIAMAQKVLRRFDPKTTVDIHVTVNNNTWVISAHTTKPEENFEGLVEARLQKLG